MRSRKMKTSINETNGKSEVATNPTAPAAPRKISTATVLASALPALLLATVCLLPYLNKPYFIDDSWFLTMSRQIIQHPTHPMDFDICWDNTLNCEKGYVLTPGNALMGYVLVPTVLGGAHEWMAHLTQLVLVWIAIIAMTSLVFRFGWDRWHATAGALLLVAIPPFLHMASTAMPDILATAIALVAMERLAAWKAEQKWTQGVAAAIALGLAGFARSHLALLLPLAAFFLSDSINPREILLELRRRLWLWTPVFAGFGILLAIILTVREHNLAINPPPLVTGSQYIFVNLLSYLLYFAFPLPLAACWLANRFKTKRPNLVFILIVVILIPLFLRWTFLLVFFLAILGLYALAGLFFQVFKRRDPTDLFLLLWILIPLPIVYYVHLPIKYLLPCMPAVILICFRLMKGFSVRVVRISAAALIAASTGYSLLILHSDAQFAEFGRDAMYRLISPHVAAGEKVWFGGQYWSYWYAPQAGATLTYTGGPQPKPGDLLVVGLFGGGGAHSPLERFPHRTLVEAISQTHRFGRIYNGMWLWGLGDTEIDRYELWRID
jgi:4-amino-4-deoxy-L-arabinose transferase-like glycosyltransferase